MNEYISREAALAHKWEVRVFDPNDPDPVSEVVSVSSILRIPAADVEPVRHAYWVKRMKHGIGRGYEVHTPVWSCSDCGRDYDPASCSIIKYCYICGAKMDGGQDDAQ